MSNHATYPISFRWIQYAGMLCFLILVAFIMTRNKPPSNVFTVSRGLLLQVISDAEGRRDTVTVKQNQRAYRISKQSKTDAIVHEIAIPDALWEELQVLKLQWCRKKPSSALPYRYAPSDVLFGVHCSSSRTANFILSATEVPAAIRELQALVPSDL